MSRLPESGCRGGNERFCLSVCFIGNSFVFQLSGGVSAGNLHKAIAGVQFYCTFAPEINKKTKR